MPYIFPTILFPDISDIKEINKLQYEDFTINNYKSHDSIKAHMIV